MLSRPKNDGPRDSQRSKLYAAERNWSKWTMGFEPSAGFETTELIKKYCDELLQHRLLKRKYSGYALRPIHVGDGRARTSGGGDHRGIYLPRATRHLPYILHELAHTIQDRTYPRNTVADHGPEFCKIFLDIVEAALGFDERQSLVTEFHKKKVRVAR